jgi:hypothetical protein
LEELARKGEGYVSDSELQGARERAEEFETRLDLETRRLQVLRDSEQPQRRLQVLRDSEQPQRQVQREQIDRLTSIVEYSGNRSIV